MNRPRPLTGPIASQIAVFFDAKPTTPATVAKDRYLKGIKEGDEDRAHGHYARSALAGATLGAILSKAGKRKGGSAIGALGGLGLQGVTRAATAHTKDAFGDRSLNGRKADWAPELALTGAAIVAGRPKLRGIAAKGRHAAGSVVRNAGRVGVRTLFGFSAKPARFMQFGTLEKVRKLLRNKKVIAGTALAGGITAADIISSAALPDSGMSRSTAAAHGLLKGAVYGTALAGAEPVFEDILQKVGRIKNQFAATRQKTIEFADSTGDTAAAPGGYKRAALIAAGAIGGGLLGAKTPALLKRAKLLNRAGKLTIQKRGAVLGSLLGGGATAVGTEPKDLKVGVFVHRDGTRAKFYLHKNGGLKVRGQFTQKSGNGATAGNP